MRKSSVFYFFFLLGLMPVTARAQWQALPFRLDGNGGATPRCFYVDTVEDALYIGGNFGMVNDTPCNIVRWDGTNFTRLPLSPMNPPLAITRFQGKLCVAGGYGAYYLDNNQWVPITTHTTYSLHHIQGKLALLTGFYTAADTVGFGRVRLWDGTSAPMHDLYSLDTLSHSGTWFPGDLQEYNGQIFICGNIDDPDGRKEIFRWDGTRWRDAEGGVAGNNLSGAGDMMVWNGHLYVTGEFSEPFGGRGNGIVRWDGTYWNRLGAALTNGTPTGGADMCEWQGKLVVTGYFRKAGGIPSTNLALWDGVRWCSLGDSFDDIVTNVVSFHDTLYVGGNFKVIDGDSIAYLARWTGSSTPDTCSDPVTITTLGVGHTPEADAAQLSVSPNPSTGHYEIRYENSSSVHDAQLTVANTVGQTVLSRRLSSAGDTARLSLDLSAQPAGLYILRVTDAAGRVHTEKLVKE